MKECIACGKLHRHRLSEEAATSIKSDTRRGSDVAREYQISQSLVSAIRKGKSWRHV